MLGAGLSRVLFAYDKVFLERAELETKTTRVQDMRIRRYQKEGEELQLNTAALLLDTGEIDSQAFTEFAREQLLDEDPEEG